MKRIGITVAMGSELRLLGESIGLVPAPADGGFLFYCGKYSGAEIIAAQSGIGKVNSALCAASMIAHSGLDCLVSTGVCGTLCADGSISAGDIICASSVRYHDVWCGSPNAAGQIQGDPESYELLQGEDLSALVEAITASGYRVHTGRLASGDWFVDTAQKAREIAELYPDASGVDMESGSLAQTCRRYAVPFLSVRMVSDAPLCPEAPAYDDFWKDAPGRLNRALMGILDYLIARQ